jgi:membrane associated rhomboid family serine protease
MIKVDPTTTVIGAVPAIFALMAAFGVHISQDLQNAILTISLAAVSYFIGKAPKA